MVKTKKTLAYTLYSIIYQLDSQEKSRDKPTYPNMKYISEISKIL